MLIRDRVRPQVFGILLTAAMAVSNALPAYAQEVHDFEITATDAKRAVHDFGAQAGLQILAAGDNLSGKRFNPISGQLSTEEGLRLMLAGTGLAHRYVGERAIALVSMDEAGESERVGGMQQTPQPIHVARLAADVASSNSERSSEMGALRDAPSPSSSMIELEEIVVTGSHIRGVQNLSSPVLTFDRKDIEASGYATAQQFISSLPQNLSNVSDTTVTSYNGGTLNHGGSGVNLRGLGSESTLVLLNGRRLAAAADGHFVDLSLIPLSAIERVEVLTDGASAIYGSDAVGGVVNLIIRQDFEGAETRLRYGSVTAGSHEELQVGQTVGGTWDTGNAWLSYEYYDRTPLNGEDRSFIRPTDLQESVELIPELTRHGMLAMIEQRLSDRAGFSSTLFYAERESAFDLNSYGMPISNLSSASQLGGNLSVSVDIARWQARLSGQFDRTASDSEQIGIVDGGQLSLLDNESRLWAVDLAADGPMGTIPGGIIRMAIGAQYRKEKFAERYVGYPADLQRDVSAAYTEVSLPWVGEDNHVRGVKRLETTLAARYEDYSDFGSTLKPKIGLAWMPVGVLTLRGTWGKSFKAPLLSQLNAANAYSAVHVDMFTGPTGPLTGMVLHGNGKELGAEKSTNWTAGFDFAPSALGDLLVSATYFDIDYENRIRSPFPSGYGMYGVLSDPDYSSLVTLNPNSGDINALLNSMLSFCQTSEQACNSRDYADRIGAVIDSRVMNLAAVRVSGIDLQLRQGWSGAMGQWVLQFNGTHMLKNVEQLSSAVEPVTQMNNVWRPVDLRLRGSLSYIRERLGASLFLNYTDSYRDTRASDTAGVLQREKVASWTTLDTTVQYQLSRSLQGAMPATTLSLSVNNILDRDPPFVSSIFGFYFDGVNASPLGRFVSAQLSVRW